MAKFLIHDNEENSRPNLRGPPRLWSQLSLCWVEAQFANIATFDDKAVQWWYNKIKLEKSCLEGFGSTCHSYIINVKMRMRIPWQTKVLSNQETWIRLECFEIFLHSRKCFSHHGVLLISVFLHPLSCYFIFVFHVCCLSTLVTFILLPSSLAPPVLYSPPSAFKPLTPRWRHDIH